MKYRCGSKSVRLLDSSIPSLSNSRNRHQGRQGRQVQVFQRGSRVSCIIKIAIKAVEMRYVGILMSQSEIRMG